MTQYEYTNQYKRETGDFYIDPPFCSEELFHRIAFKGTVHDPACGTGTIIISAMKAGLKISFADKYQQVSRPFPNQVDYLTDTTIYDNIVTNPPYNLVEEFAHHALAHTENKIAILARLAFLEGQRRYKTLYSKTPPTYVLVFSRRPSMPPPGVPVGGGKTAYCWLVWDKRISNFGFKTRLDWII